MKTIFTLCLFCASLAYGQNSKVFYLSPGSYEGRVDIGLVLTAADEGCSTPFLNNEITEENLKAGNHIVRVDLKKKFDALHITVTFDRFIWKGSIQENAGFSGLCYPKKT